MAFSTLTNNLKGFTDHTQQYIKTTAEYYKLSLFKNSMQGLIGVANLALRASFGLLFLVFVSIGGAIYIGEHMGNNSVGFFIIGAFYFLIFLLVFAFAGKPLERMLLKKYSKMAFNKDQHTPVDAVQPLSQVPPTQTTINTLPDESI